ncbi:hypothetical protein F4815DRAFT_279513 [Daldinia loculata]|nr:hypothetical protein F4815DRAFT_279513 [Daldinia loculata]
MLYFILLSAVITWCTVFTLWLARYPQLLLRTARWGINIWMLVFGLLGMRAVTAGFDSIDPESMSNYPAPTTVFWFFYIWYGVVCVSVVYKGYLAPAFLVLLAVAFGCPELRTLMDYGLISLGWLDWVYNPGFTLMVEMLSAGLKHRT